MLISNVSASSLSLESPPEVFLNDNFSVGVSYETSDILDIKIFIQDSSSKILSEIYNSGWKSSFYYLQSVFPQKSNFTLRAVKSAGSLQICVKLRKGKQVLAETICKLIVVKINEEEQSAPAVNNTTESLPRSEEPERNNSAPRINRADKPRNVISLTNQSTNITNNSPPPRVALNNFSENERIYLSARASELRNNTSWAVFISKEEKMPFYILASFSFFLLLILLFIIKNKGKV